MKLAAVLVALVQVLSPLEAYARDWERDNNRGHRSEPRNDHQFRRQDPPRREERRDENRWRQHQPQPQPRYDDRRRWEAPPQQHRTPPVFTPRERQRQHDQRWVSPPVRRYDRQPAYRRYDPRQHHYYRPGPTNSYGRFRYRGRRWIIWGGVGALAMWTTWYMGRMWWYDDQYGRWCYRHNDRWYWRDGGQVYYYDESSADYRLDPYAERLDLQSPDVMPPSGEPQEGEVEPDADEDRPQVSADGTRRVEVRPGGNAWLFSDDESRRTIFLGAGASAAYFEGNIAVVEYPDGRREAFDLDGAPAAVPMSAPDMDFPPLDAAPRF